MHKITGCTFEQSYFEYNGSRWSARQLYDAAKEQKCKRFKYPLKFMDLSDGRWNDGGSVADEVSTYMRIRDTDTSIPILFGPLMTLMDGYHRVARALADGDDFVWAYRLEELPDPDGGNYG